MFSFIRVIKLFNNSLFLSANNDPTRLYLLLMLNFNYLQTPKRLFHIGGHIIQQLYILKQISIKPMTSIYLMMKRMLYIYNTRGCVGVCRNPKITSNESQRQF